MSLPLILCLLAIVASIVIGYKFKFNTGVIALAFAFIIGNLVMGLKVNDILLKANGKELHTNAELAEIKSELKIGDTITFTVWRDGKTFDINVKLMDANDIFK